MGDRDLYVCSVPLFMTSGRHNRRTLNAPSLQAWPHFPCFFPFGTILVSCPGLRYTQRRLPQRMSVQHAPYDCAMPTTSPREQTLRKRPSQNRLEYMTPLDSQPKSKMNAGGSAMSRSATISHSPPHRTSKTASPSRGPGLTVRIEHDMMANISQSIQSAPPTRTLRRLPIPPLSSTPSTALPKYFSDTSLNPLTPKRIPRPLPYPPPLSKDHSNCFNTTPEVSPPTTCPPMRVFRPLPTPVQKVDPSPLNLDTLPLGTSSPQPLLSIPPLVISAWTSPLKPLGEKNSYSKEKPTHNGLRTPRINEWKNHLIHADDDDDSREGVYDKENHCDGDISLLQKRILLAPPRASLDSDMSVKSPKSPDATRNAHLSRTKGDVHTDLILDLEDGEEDLHVDYAWVLSNRILYHQGAQQHISKWVREKNGKRYTEQDYENILKVLRTL